MTNSREPNRLIHEKSPYLLQHAHNPVEWYPWGEEAFNKAKAEDKPIFLSIGYSTCHWCHVMERESFEDDEVAELLNKAFVAIKVDREERPDVDHIYMEVCQMLTGGGGWPLTIMMTPDRKPFFAGTYYPKKSRMGLPGIMELLAAVQKNWSTNRTQLLDTSQKLMETIENRGGRTAGTISEEALNKAYRQFSSSYDEEYGGFRGAPKFPTPHNLYFLLRYWHTTNGDKALRMVTGTLERMHRGGIYDHIGFGFSRYSTDNKWLVPHFEKMLYDNALLAIAYLEAYLATKNQRFSRVASEIFTYVLRDMTSPEGAFFSAEDADSEGVEGKFYVWTPDEVLQVLGKEDGKRFCALYDITDKGNFEGKNIPNLINADLSVLDQQFVEDCRKKLFAHRETRIHPYKDDKVLTAWNGLMIAAFAIGGRVLGDASYTAAAERAAGFVLTTLVREDGRLLARYRDGEAAFLAYADDYAFLVWSLIELYETTYKPEYLKHAIRLNEESIKLFWDEEDKGFFLYGSDGEQLLTRPKEIYDGATPSGNSVAALNLIRLARLTGEVELEERAADLLRIFSRDINGYPAGFAFALTAIQHVEAKGKELVLAGPEGELTKLVRSMYLPFLTVLSIPEDPALLSELKLNIEAYKPINGKSTAYVCENFACRQPVTEPEELKKILQE